MTVKIRVENGVAYVDEVPSGVTVRVIDYDVAPESPERDDAGRPCSAYSVDGRRPARHKRDSGPGLSAEELFRRGRALVEAGVTA